MCSTTRGLCECTDFAGFLTTMAEFKTDYSRVKSGIEAHAKAAHKQQTDNNKPPVDKQRSSKGCKKKKEK